MTAKPESRLRARIAQALRARGHLVLVQHGGAWTGPGRSDLIVCAQGRFIALEVKTGTGRTTDAQERFLVQVRAAGGVSAVVRSPDEALRVVEGATMNDIEIDLDGLFGEPITAPPPEPVVEKPKRSRAKKVEKSLDDYSDQPLPLIGEPSTPEIVSGHGTQQPVFRVNDEGEIVCSSERAIAELYERVDALAVSVDKAIEMMLKLMDMPKPAPPKASAAPKRSKAPVQDTVSDLLDE